MPLYRIYHAKGLFSAEAKQAISERITNVFSHLPRFYVVVVFLEVEPQDLNVGGQCSPHFVRFVPQHLAQTKQQGGPEDAKVRALQCGVPCVLAVVVLALCVQGPQPSGALAAHVAGVAVRSHARSLCVASFACYI